MRLIRKEELTEKYTCWDIEVEDTHCFFAEGILTHNSNAGVVLKPNEFYCQSRERIITPDSDNFGFATYVSTWTEDDWKIIRSNFPADVTVALYGEWAGGNIQGTVALKSLPKTFYPFAARIISGDGEKEEWLDIRNWVFPEFIKNIYNFPVYELDINFEESEYAVEKINKWVLEVEAECPVGKAQGVSGIGEGIVFKPIDPNYNSSRYWMKCKGSEHSKSKVKKLATVNIEKFETNKAFVESALDEERLEQGYQWVLSEKGSADVKQTGDFIRWIYNDVLKEKKLEMEASDISEKELGGLLSGPAKKWYFARINL